jgi:RAB protein geranylgeranyltransferase component A
MNNFHLVPQSKEDVFASKVISLVEKRKLMRLLAEAQKDTGRACNSNQGLSFLEYLRNKSGLHEKLQNLVGYALAFSKLPITAISAEEGLERTRKYLFSLGVYGPGAMLLAQYGMGELPQAFSR